MSGLRAVARVVLWAGCSYHLALLVHDLASGATGAAALPLLGLALLTTWLGLLPVLEARLDAQHALLLEQIAIAKQVAAGLQQGEVTVTPIPPAPLRTPGRRVN